MDRAGNTVTITRRYLADANIPTAASIAAPAAITTSNPTLGVTYADEVKVVGAFVSFTYGINLDGIAGIDTLKLPYQAQSTPFGTPLNATSATASLSIATPAPMATSVNITSATTYTKLSSFGVTVNDAIGNALSASDAMAAGGITTQTDLTAGLTFTVNTSLAAANGAGAGLKATFNTASTSGTNVFTRVDFYRRRGANNGGTNQFEYLGSGTAPIQSTDLNGNQLFTYVIDSYANRPTAAVAQPAAASGDVILAMAVRSTGAATISTATTIGGPAIRVTITGTEGNAGNVVITGPNGFTQTVTVSGTYGMPTAGDYTVTQFPITTASGGRYFITGNAASANLGTLTLVANGAPQDATTAAYLARKFTLTYSPATNTTAWPASWPSIPTGAFATLTNATTGFSQQFRSATAGFVLAPAGTGAAANTFADFVVTTGSSATSTLPIETVSSVAYALTNAAGTFGPANNTSATNTVNIVYEWSNSFNVVYECNTDGVNNNGTDNDGFRPEECPALTGGYLIGSGTAPTFSTLKTVTGAASAKYHALSGSPSATTRLRFNGSFAADTAPGWISRTATVDSIYGVSTGHVVTPGLSSAAVTARVKLVRAVITIAPARVNDANGAQFQPNVTITKDGDAACTVTLPAITSGAAASANRLYNPTCGAGTYFVTYTPTVVGGNTIAWITGAGARIQSAAITGAAPAPAALAAVWMN